MTVREMGTVAARIGTASPTVLGLALTLMGVFVLILGELERAGL